MKTQQNHNGLKEVARKILFDMGFLEKEIQEEYWVGDSRFKKAVRVDVVGINQQKKVAVECGFTSGDKIAALKMYFDDVIILPYFTINFEKENYERTIREQVTKIEELSKKERDLNEKLDHKRTDTYLLKGFLDKVIQLILWDNTIYWMSPKNQHELILELKKDLDDLDAKLQRETDQSPK